MPLEDLVGPNKYLDALVKEWPLGIDAFSEGDDHIRGIKNVLLNTFGPLAQLYDVSDAAYKSEANTFTGANEFQGQHLTSAAGPGPVAELLQENASPAALDLLGQLALKGRNSSAAAITYADILATILDPTTASEDGELIFRAVAAGAMTEVFRAGKGIHLNGATSGDPGTGLINAQGYQVNGQPFVGQTPLDQTIISTPTPEYVLTWDNADDYREIAVTVTELVCQNNNAGIELALSSNAGSSWHGSYDWRRVNITGSYGSGNGIGASEIQLTATGTSGFGNAHEGQVSIRIGNPGLAQPSVDWSAHGLTGAGTVVTWLGSGKADQMANANAMRLRFQSTFNIAQAQIKASGYR